MSALTPQSEIGQLLLRTRLIAVLVIDDAETAVPVAESLLRGGIETMELTLRTPAALESARRIRDSVSGMTVGIGTVLTEDQVSESRDAGAQFAVSPGVNPRVIRKAASLDLPFGPGVMTPTDIDTAIGEGCRLLKYFPAESAGGITHLQNIAAPFQHLGIQFIPLGGITLGNLASYLENDLIGAVGGSWLAPRDLIRDRNWSLIEERARAARDLIG